MTNRSGEEKSDGSERGPWHGDYTVLQGPVGGVVGSPTWVFRECHRSVGWDEAGAIVQVVGSLSLMV